MTEAKGGAPAQGAGDGGGKAVRATQADIDALEAREMVCAVFDANDGTYTGGAASTTSPRRRATSSASAG